MREEGKRDGYFVLTKISRHNIVNFLDDRTLEEAREEQVGFANRSDNGVAGITTSRGVADGWEARCYHLQRRRTSAKKENS